MLSLYHCHPTRLELCHGHSPSSSRSGRLSKWEPLTAYRPLHATDASNADFDRFSQQKTSDICRVTYHCSSFSILSSMVALICPFWLAGHQLMDFFWFCDKVRSHYWVNGYEETDRKRRRYIAYVNKSWQTSVERTVPRTIATVVNNNRQQTWDRKSVREDRSVEYIGISKQ